MFAILLSLLLSQSATAAFDNQNNAILSQVGCFNVSYDSHEMGTYDPEYPTKGGHFHTGATELVIPDLISENEIILQHITVFQGKGEMHWAQTWKRAPETVFVYKGQQTWAHEKVENPKGKWSQFVGQVDQSPRYDCAAEWKIDGGVKEWACKSWSPLPRREGVREDYGVLERGNRHMLTENGWIHLQENRKLIVKDGVVKPIAAELTVNTYDRIDEKECAPAVDLWKKDGPAWRVVRGMWRELMASRSSMKFRSEKVDGMYLWMRLFMLVEEQTTTPVDEAKFRAKVKTAIEEFLL